MKPFAHIIIVISWRHSAGSCALWLEREPEIESALQSFKNKFPPYMRPYASIPVYSEISRVWDIYVDFIRRRDGVINEGLCFNKDDPDELYLKLFKESIDECAKTQFNEANSPKCYLTKYAVLVSTVRVALEYVSVFNWFDDGIDCVKEHVSRFLVDKKAQVCAVFESAPTSFLSILKTSSMASVLQGIPTDCIRFVEMPIRTALRDAVNQWTAYNSADITAAEYRIYCDYVEE